MCGRLLLEKISVNKRIVKLITVAVIMLVIGYVLSIWMPINKRIWSTTFVLVTCGWGSLLLALLMYVIDVKNINKGWTFFLVFGQPLRSLISPVFTIHTARRNNNCTFLGRFWYFLQNHFTQSMIFSAIQAFIT